MAFRLVRAVATRSIFGRLLTFSWFKASLMELIPVAMVDEIFKSCTPCKAVNPEARLDSFCPTFAPMLLVASPKAVSCGATVEDSLTLLTLPSAFKASAMSRNLSGTPSKRSLAVFATFASVTRSPKPCPLSRADFSLPRDFANCSIPLPASVELA